MQKGFLFYLFLDLNFTILPDVKLRELSKFSKLEFFGIFCRWPLRSALPQRNYAEIISIWNESNFYRKYRTRDFIQQITVVYDSNETHIIMHNLKHTIWIDWNFGNKLLLFISSDSCHKKRLLESINILLSSYRQNINFSRSCAKSHAQRNVNSLCIIEWLELF